MYRILEGLNWQVPDWIVVPGGNLGNSSSFGKAFMELKQLGLIDRVPRLAIINAAGANTLTELVNDHGLRWNDSRVDNAKIDAYYPAFDITPPHLVAGIITHLGILSPYDLRSHFG
jgi:threonine synthase